MSEPSESATKEWMPRAEELIKTPHVRHQARRAYKAYKIIHGTKDAMRFKDFLREVAQLVALVEVTGEKTTACVGGVMVQRGPMEGYGIHLWAADVFVMRLGEHSNGGFRRAMDLWKRGEKSD